MTTKPSDIMGKKIDDRDRADVFVGRQAELSTLLDLVTVQKSRSDSPDSELATSLKALVMTAAPGAGKTAILCELERLLRQLGMGALVLHPEHLESDETLIERLRKLKLREQAEQAQSWWRDKWVRVRSMDSKSLRAKIGAGADIAVNTLIKIKTGAHGLPWLGRTQIASRVLDAITGRSITDPTAVLKACNEAFPQGWLIIVDEAQQLYRLKDTRTARRLISAMSRPKARQDEELSHGNMVLAGLNDSHQIVETLGGSRTAEHFLRPLAAEDVEQLIRAQIELGEQENGGTPVPHREDWINQLSEKYQIWTQHAQCAAWSAHWMASNHPTAADGFEWVQRRADEGITDYYGQRLRQASDWAPEGLILAVIDRVEQGPKKLSVGELRSLISVARSVPEVEEMAESDNQNVVLGLLHSGLLEPDVNGQLSIPIPSLASHCRAVLVPNKITDTVNEHWQKNLSQ